MLATLRELIPRVAESETAGKVARIATRAVERKARKVICAALPASQAQAPADLYTPEPIVGGARADHPTCEALFPQAGWDLALAGHMAWDHEHEAVLEYYDRVLDTGDFERQMCPRALAGLSLGAIARELRIKLPEIVASNSASGLAIARMIAHTKASGTSSLEAKRVAEALQVTLIETIIREAEPSRGMLAFLVGPTLRSAEDLRNMEVAYKTLTPGEPKPTALVDSARAAMWDAIVANKPLDMTRFGAKHAYVPIASLRSSTTQFSPNRKSMMSAATMDVLGRWGVAASVERIARLARARAAEAHPATIGRAMSAHSAASGLYVEEQHIGYERSGLGYPLVVALDALRAIRRKNDAAYAHAARCLLVYIRDLVFTGERIPEPASDAAIDGAIGALPQRGAPNTPAPPNATFPRVPLLCRAPPTGHNARTRRVIRQTCALNAELVEKSRTVERLRQSLGTNAAAESLTLEQMLALHEDLGSVALVASPQEQGAIIGRAASALNRLSGLLQRQLPLNRIRDAAARVAESARRVTDTRRVAVLLTMLTLLAQRGGPVAPRGLVGPVRPDPYEGVYAHIEMCAELNEPHALKDEELGVLHSAYEAAGKIAFIKPMLQPAPPSSAVMWLVGEVTPTCISDAAATAAESGADLVRVREVQYKATEPPGVGYALYALLPILDHVSAMCKGESERTQRDYAPLRGATLRAIRCLLQPP